MLLLDVRAVREFVDPFRARGDDGGRTGGSAGDTGGRIGGSTGRSAGVVSLTVGTVVDSGGDTVVDTGGVGVLSMDEVSIT